MARQDCEDSIFGQRLEIVSLFAQAMVKGGGSHNMLRLLDKIFQVQCMASKEGGLLRLDARRPGKM